MWRKIECVVIYTQDIEKSIRFYEMLGLTKSWDTFQDEQNKWRLVGMTFPDGNSELVLKGNPDLQFSETEIIVSDVKETYEMLKDNEEVIWVRNPFPNHLVVHVAVMQAPDEDIFVLIGK